MINGLFEDFYNDFGEFKIGVEDRKHNGLILHNVNEVKVHRYIPKENSENTVFYCINQ